jgi:hypothetical protein
MDFDAREMPFRPVTTVEQIDAMETDTVVRGYRAGFKNTPDYTQREQAYWHGYLNGQVDGKHMQISDEQRQLARAVVARQRAN